MDKKGDLMVDMKTTALKMHVKAVVFALLSFLCLTLIAYALTGSFVRAILITVLIVMYVVFNQKATSFSRSASALLIRENIEKKLH